MEPKGFHRKLAAILSADVTGSSRLMQDDEAATVKIPEPYKQFIFDLVKQHRAVWWTLQGTTCLRSSTVVCSVRWTN